MVSVTTTQLIIFQTIIHERFYIVISKEIATELFVVTHMTAVTKAVLFRSESMGSGSAPVNVLKACSAKILAKFTLSLVGRLFLY